MKKKLKYLLFIMCFALLFVVKTDLTDADDSIGGGATGDNTPCVGSWCEWGYPGFRITIVQKETGNRCYYDPITHKVCTDGDSTTTLTNKTGYKLSTSQDFWLSHVGPSGDGICKEFENKLTKKEIVVSKKSSGDVVNCSGWTDYTELGLTSKYGWFEAWDEDFIFDEGKKGIPMLEQPHFVPERIIPQLECLQDPKRGKEKYGVNCTNTSMDLSVFNNIFTYAFYGYKYEEGSSKPQVNALTLDQGSLKHTYIQFEQLLEPAAFKGGNIYGVRGSVTEVAKFCANPSGTFYVNNVNYTLSSPNACAYTLPRAWWSGWNAKNSESGSWSDDWEHSKESTKKWSYSNFYINKDTISVADFWFSPDACAMDLNDALQKSNKSKYDGLFNKYKEDYDDLSFLKNWDYETAKFWYDKLNTQTVDFTCYLKLKCHEKAKAIFKACGSTPSNRCTVGGNSYDNYEAAIIKYSNNDDTWVKNSVGTFAKTTNNSFQINSSNYYQNQWHSIYMKYQRKLVAGFYPTSCAAVACDQTNVDKLWVKVFNRNYENEAYGYDEYFNWLFKATGQTKHLLLSNFWTITVAEGPSCEGVPVCNADTNINNACGSSIVLSDYKFGANDAEAKRCWQSGFAYTNNLANPVGSFVKQIGSGNNVCKLYCSEQVSFNLPGEVNNDNAIRAGTIFKWGVIREKRNTILGEIKITKKCAVSNPQILNSEGERITPDCTGINFSYTVDEWKSKIATAVELNYSDPTNKYSYNGLNNFVIQTSEPNSGSKSIVNARCSNATCTNLTPDMLTTEATFNIVYTDWLNWYGNKTTGEPVAKRTAGSTLQNSELAWYKWIGYGLPTAFMTPNGTYGVRESSDGKLSLTLDHIGTTYHNGNDAHFDELVKQKFGTSSIKYSCSFRIINELFGNDCKYDASGRLTSDSPDYCDPTDDDKVDYPNPGTDRNRFIRDIDVVFRVIDLISDSNVAPNGSIIGNAFPGILGNGRVRGRNWAKLSDSEIEDILREDIYQKEPMYSLELNTANIQYIRKLNRDARESKGTYVAADPYTEMRRFNGDNDLTDMSSLPGYTGYYCASYDANPTTGKDSYKYCASRFLSLLASDSFKGHGGAMLEGSCVGHNSTAKERALKYVKPDSSSNFVGCPKN